MHNKYKSAKSKQSSKAIMNLTVTNITDIYLICLKSYNFYFFFFFKQKTAYEIGLGIPAEPLFRSTKNQAVATSQEAVQNQNEPQLRDENAHNDKSVHGVLNPTYQAGLRRDAVQPDIEAERKKRDEIEAGKSYCSRRFGGATCDDKSAQIYARFDKNDWRIQPAEFYRFHDAEVNTFGYF